jgi:hypothetical protein
VYWIARPKSTEARISLGLAVEVERQHCTSPGPLTTAARSQCWAE